MNRCFCIACNLQIEMLRRRRYPRHAQARFLTVKDLGQLTAVCQHAHTLVGVKQLWEQSEIGTQLLTAAQTLLAKYSEASDEEYGLLEKDTAVVISGLVSAAQHNGKHGKVLDYTQEGRYVVQLDSDGDARDGSVGEQLLVTPSCLLEGMDTEQLSDRALDEEAGGVAKSDDTI